MSQGVSRDAHSGSEAPGTSVAPARSMAWPPKRILVGTDFSPAADAALDAAAALARRVGAALDLLHAVPRSVPDRAAARARLDDLARKIEPAPRVHFAPGPIAAELGALRDLLRVDLVALGGGHLSGVRHFLFGSLADRVLRRPGCPLLLVNERPPAGEFKKILVAQESPERATPWLELALHLAHAERGEIVLVHVLPPKGYLSDAHHVELEPERAPERLAELLARLDPTVPAQVDVRQGDAAHEIVAAAREHAAHLVVLGAERNRDGWPGRVADRVARAGLPALLYVWPEREAAEDFDGE
jgi:nucleotide-binding universal stress UspA family protein